MTTYLRTDFNRTNITTNKLYKVIEKFNSNSGYIIFDNGKKHYTKFKKTAHLNGRDWEVIEMNDDNLPQIGDECEFSDNSDFDHNCFANDPWKAKLIATTSDGRFIDEDDDIWNYCRKAKNTVKVVKKASEIIKWCEDHGYEYRKYGLIKQGLTTLFWEKLEFCGKEPNECYTYHEDWLEEKVID